MDETSLRAMFDRAVSERPPATSAGHARAQTAYIWTGTDSVTPVRLSTGQVLTPLTIPGVIQNISATPNGKAVYVFSNTEPSTNKSPLVSYVMAINSATGKASRPVKLTGNGLVTSISAAQFAPNGKLAYATEMGTWPANGKYGGWALVAINLATGAQRKLAELGGGFGWAISPDGRTAYDAGDTGEVMAVDLATDTVLPPVKLQAPGTVDSVAFAPGGRTACAASVTRPAPGSGRVTTWVTPISTATNIAAKPIETQTTGFGPQISIAPDGETGYLSGGQYLCPVNLASGTALEPIKLPSAFAQYLSVLGISPNSEFGYEYQPRSASVQLINLSSGSVLRPVALPGGYRQSAAGFSPGGSTIYVPASIYRGALPSLGAVFPVQPATRQAGKPILFSGVPNGAVIMP